MIIYGYLSLWETYSKMHFLLCDFKIGENPGIILVHGMTKAHIVINILKFGSENSNIGLFLIFLVVSVSPEFGS